MDDFFDLDPDQRAATYNRAEQETGMNFYDLDPEERAYYYERALE